MDVKAIQKLILSDILNIFYCFKYIIIVYTMSQYLDTGMPPSERSSYFSICKEINEAQTQEFFNAQSTMIAFDHDLILTLRKIQTVQGHLIITAIILSLNGSIFKFHGRYQKTFNKFFNSTQYINYGLIHIQDHFTVELVIKLNSFDACLLTKQNYKQEISQVFKKYKKWLIFVGQLRKRNRFSLQIDKKSLQLRTHVIKSLLNKLNEQNQQPRNLQILDNNNNIHQLYQAKQVLTPNQKIVNLKNKNSRISINKKLFQITHLNGSVQTVHLAQKTVRNPHQVANSLYFNKVVAEINLVKLIKSKKYLLNYYTIPEERGIFYMEYLQKCLKKVIYNQQIGVNEILKFSKQLIEAVDLLHLSNVAHRDLKMENILVKNCNGERMLKIIDFGQSSIIGAEYDENHSLGATLPYSPIQCMLELEEGFNNPAIDLWSILVIIYQMIYKQLPLFFSYDLRMEIAQGWRSQGNFSLMLPMRPKRGLTKIEEYICILTEEGLKIEQKERLKLRVLSEIIEGIINFQNRMNQTFQKFI